MAQVTTRKRKAQVDSVQIA